MTTVTLTTPAIPVPVLGIALTPARGFPGLPCLYCTETDCIDLDLSDLDGKEAFRCGRCEAGFGLTDVRAKLYARGRVLAWIELPPPCA
jgi:hypothetical protein